MDKEKIIEAKIYDVKPFKRLIIGDPSYFEELDADPVNNAHLLNMTCDMKLKKYKYGFVKIVQRKMHSEEYDFDYETIDLSFGLANREDIIDTYKIDRWFGDKTLVEQYELGCDTASFLMQVDDNYEEIKTGADGYYGDVKLLKDDYGLLGNISFDGSLFTFKDVEDYAKYWFNVIE